MALIKCTECSAEVSDMAAACPKCGHPLDAAVNRVCPTAPPPSEVHKGGGWFKWVVIVPVVLFGMMLLIGKASDPDGKQAAARLQSQMQECSAAMVSSIGHSTVGYADKVAYDAKVKEKCAGLSLDGKDLGR